MATGAQLAAHLGVSGAAVSKALKAGQLDGAVRWETQGTRRVAVYDLARATELWMARPGARAPALEGIRRTEVKPAQEQPPPVAHDGYQSGDALSDIAAARLKYEQAKANNEQLEFDLASGKLIAVARAMEIFGRQIQEAKTAIMALGKHARGRLPHLTVDDVVTIEELCREALEGLSTGSIANTVGEGTG